MVLYQQNFKDGPVVLACEFINIKISVNIEDQRNCMVRLTMEKLE